jgi:DNA-binding phage protein
MQINKAVVNRSRLRNGLFIGELAKLAGMSEAAVARAISTGHCGLKVARSIAKALGLKLADILIEEDESMPATPQEQTVPELIAVSA